MAEILQLMRTAPSAFLRWWLGELGSLLPGWLTPAAGRARTALILDVYAERSVLRASRPRSEEIIGEIGGDDDALSLPALRARRYRRWPLIVRLAPDLGMRKIVDLPLAAKTDLGNLLHFELDRLTPFKPEDVYFAWRVLDTDPASSRMSVALEMTPRARVDRLVDQAAMHGRSVDRVEIAGTGEREPLDLLSRDAKTEPGGRLRRLLPLIVVALALVAVWIPIDRQERAIDRLDGEIALLKGPADHTLAVRERLDAMATEAGFLAEAKNDRASMTFLLAELTRLVPDHSHIVQLEIDDGSVRISGFADRASDLITALDRSATFTSPIFRSAVTRDPRLDKERFQIAVELAEAPS